MTTPTSTQPGRLPSTKQDARCPRLPAGFSGVILSPVAPLDGSSPPVVHGAFQLTEEQAGAIDERLHRAILVVADNLGGARVSTPFCGRAVFEDDEVRENKLRRGYFSVALDGPLRLTAGTTWFLHASLGPFVSDIQAVQVR
jgi:hypothetical protein